MTGPTTDDALVEELARKLADAEGLDFDEVCGVDANPDEGYCDSGSCVAAFYEDHDAEQARRHYLHSARAILPIIANREAEARAKALDEAAAEAEAWFPHGTMQEPRYAAGKSLYRAIRALKDKTDG
ncbi:MAG: hypothetical protein KGM49_00720 [Sphingomonadales bacterium]|nr:hypothetical protein [Sphingomonadales bacterium]